MLLLPSFSCGTRGDWCCTACYNAYCYLYKRAELPASYS